MDSDYFSRTDWEIVGSYLNAVAERVDRHDFSGVFGIPRGGQVLASWLAHKLYLPLLLAPQPNCIIIDDICESGNTLRKWLSHDDVDPCKCFITVMYYRKGSCDDKVDYYYEEKGDSWTVFPWEQ